MPYHDDYASPEPYPLVLWCHEKGMPTCPGFVTATFARTCSVTVFPQDFPRGICKDGVRHIDDPIAPHISPDDGGGYWDYTPDQKILRAISGEDAAPVNQSRKTGSAL